MTLVHKKSSWSAFTRFRRQAWHEMYSFNNLVSRKSMGEGSAIVLGCLWVVSVVLLIWISATLHSAYASSIGTLFVEDNKGNLSFRYHCTNCRCHYRSFEEVSFLRDNWPHFEHVFGCSAEGMASLADLQDWIGTATQ